MQLMLPVFCVSKLDLSLCAEHPNFSCMKNLLACLAMLAAFNVSAQTETSNFPYNPDVNGDGLIGVNDILAALQYYDSQFQIAAQLNADSTSAIHFPPGWTTPMRYYDCLSRCDSLPGPWQVMSPQGFATHLSVIQDSLITNGDNAEDFWQKGWGDLTQDNEVNQLPFARINQSFAYSYPMSTGGAGLTYTKWCLCELRQRPRVEYDFCEGSMANIQPCAAEKVSQGWYPLELTSAGGAVFVQTFWRWED